MNSGIVPNRPFPPTSDTEQAAAWLLAFSGLSTHVGRSANLEALADRISPPQSRADNFDLLLNGVRTDVRHVFADKATAAQIVASEMLAKAQADAAEAKTTRQRRRPWRRHRAPR